MRIDVVSIFPGYLAPLELSLPGRARAGGLLDLRVHDLRDWTHDRHRTVDDAPYGGGAGMVMRPEPWGEALDALGVDGATLVVPTPSGLPFTQALARDLATRERLVLACGRYEGIDQRVVDHYRGRTEVLEVSLGDFVLNGGEVAALAVIEAVVRLLPGFMGNAESLVEESHEDGLLEYPVFTRPPSWRGLDVPPVLLSGDHGAVAAWRHEQRVRRTAQRRPDLLAPGALPGGETLRPAVPADAGELSTLQAACAAGATGPPVVETVEQVAAWLGDWTVLVAHRGGRLVAAGRARADDAGEGAALWLVDRVLVAPDLRRQGLGRSLLVALEAAAPPGADLAVDLPAGSDLVRPLRRGGYRPRGGPGAGVVRLVRRRAPR
jgi:tRNA (guanine37-N1)-methyltransferase